MRNISRVAQAPPVRRGSLDSRLAIKGATPAGVTLCASASRGRLKPMLARRNSETQERFGVSIVAWREPVY